ncbi:MAG TPA: DUF4185 domain-containing protein [Candidatus Saccharimonadales bacterium]|nr:DUF4185 domain-containing protein [Candidatus Saccharimonadales bacterium]
MFNEKFGLKKTFAESYNPLCIGNPGPPKLNGTVKVIQLTGDTDRERNCKTNNQTASRYKIYGTDLGVSFPHNGKLYFLFGDTTRRGPDEGLPQTALPGTHFNEDETDYDAIAYSTSYNAYEGISLIFNSSPPIVDNISQLTAEHPIEGLSVGNEMYVYFTTDMLQEKRIMPTRSVLARSLDGGYTFGNSLYTLSTHKFIHVSVQIIENDKIKGLPKKTGYGLLIWGTGKYRQSDIYLAYMSLEDLATRSSILYFAGFQENSGIPAWTIDEAYAKELFSAGCIGEISIRWNGFLDKWIMLYNCDLCNQSGVVVKTADKPWGPWSPSKIVFDNSDAYGHFMHKPGLDILHDKDRDHETNPYDVGYAYGPYQIAPYSTGIRGRYTKIYFTLSTWNPYQVVQMSSILLSEQEEKNPLPYATTVNDRNDRKFAYVSILITHLAKSKKISFDNIIGNSIFIADQIEWAQFHDNRQLRSELKKKFAKLFNDLIAVGDKAEAFAAIISAVLRLSFDYELFGNTVNVEVYRKWALQAITSGKKQMLVEEVNSYIDSRYFLPDHNYLCYAYDCNDPNEFKYARLCVLKDKLLSDKLNKTIDFEFDYSKTNSYVTWARFRHTSEMQMDLLTKFKEMFDTFSNKNDIAHAYSQIVKTIKDLTSNSNLIEPSPDYYKWALDIAQSNKLEPIINNISCYINDEDFLVSCPSNNVPVQKKL